MKVRVIGASEPYWWYQNHIGKEFDVTPDEKMPQYYYTLRELNGRMREHHIFKCDCEVVDA